MLHPRWFCRRDPGGFAIWLAAIGPYDASIVHIGERRWSWLIRRDSRDIAEGTKDNLTDAKHAALAATLTADDRAIRTHG